jgi:glucose/arabinose dehydrogenase
MLINRLLLLSLLIFASVSFANPQLELKQIAVGLTIPWGMAEIDNTLYVTQREGKLTAVDIETGSKIEIKGLPKDILATGQGGLFDIKVSPHYHTDRFIYFSYNKDIGQKGTTTLARAKLSDNTLTDWEDLFIANAISDEGVHYGGRISFDHQGHVFLSIGDRGHRPNGQDTKTHAGSIIRLNLDGSVPSDNPFIETPQILPEIWSYGHRNPQGLFYNTETHQLWSIEHGPRGGDEINLIEPGKNYGWAEISYGKEYWAPIAVGNGTEKEGMEQPIHKYIPSIAPSSLIQYIGDAIPNFTGKLLVGALAGQHLNVVSVDKPGKFVQEERELEHINKRIRNITQLEDKRLILSTDSGEIFLISPYSQ